MALSWSGRRKFLYTTVVAIIGGTALLFGYVTFFTNPPTCFDGAQNGTERGIDCGGGCALLCRADTKEPIVLWSRAFEVAPGVYTAAAYVQNPNIGAGARGVPYTFQLYDADNRLVVEREGTIDIPPVQTVPFIDPNISVGNRTPVRAIFSFTGSPVWKRAALASQLQITDQFLAADGTRLSARVHNEAGEEAKRVAVVAVLFDKDGVALAASRSIIPAVPRKSSQGVSFTWPEIPGVVRGEVTVLPSF